MSSGAIRSSSDRSTPCATISERRLSPNWSRIAVSSSPMIVGHARRLGEDVEQVDDLRHHFAVLAGDLVLLESGQALQPQFEDRLRLRVGELVPGRRRTSLPAELRRAVPRGAPHPPPRAPASPRPAPSATIFAISAAFASAGVARALISAMISSTFDSATARPSRMWPRSRALRSSKRVRRTTTSRRCCRKNSRNCLRLRSARLAVDQRHHVHAEAVLQLRQLEEVVEDDLGDFAALQLDHHAHARLVGLVAQVGDAFELLLAHQLADARSAGSPCSPGRGSRRR